MVPAERPCVTAVSPVCKIRCRFVTNRNPRAACKLDGTASRARMLRDRRDFRQPRRAVAVTDQPHILVVDDDPAVCRMLARYFSDEGFQITTAEN